MDEINQTNRLHGQDPERFRKGLSLLLRCNEEASYSKNDQPDDYEAAIKARREKTLANRRRMHLTEHSIEFFLREESLFRFDPEGQISSGEFYALYRSWCMEQKILPEPMRNFCVYLKRNEEEDPIAPSSSILTENKRYVRGFRGIRGLTEQEQREHTSDTSIKYSDELEKKRVVCVHV